MYSFPLHITLVLERAKFTLCVGLIYEMALYTLQRASRRS
nr:MAG TPA: hypothetical protein [Caudoviricetes sp.]